MTDAGDEGQSTAGGDGARTDADGTETVPCPDCGESLPAGARFCPFCETAIDESGEVVDLSDLEGFDAEGQPEFLEIEDGERRATGRVRALTGMAVAIPLAPLVLFLANAVVSLTVWSAPVVFLVGWFVCGAALSRARVPIEAFGRSLYLLAIGTALVPVALLYGDTGLSIGTSGSTFRVVAVACAIIAGAMLLLGQFVTRQGRRRVTGEDRAFENAREED